MDAPNGRGARLSLCMIVRDESKFLAGCLESVRGLVDEMIVVDTGSTDDTAAIASAAGARVYPFAWRNDFAAARNESFSRCTAEWVLFLDADERFAAGQEESLRRLLDDADASAYTLLVRSRATMPTGPSVQVMPYARLVRRDGRFRFEGTIHEQISPSIERAGGTVKPSALVIEHLGYGQGVDVLRKKAERNIPLLRERLRKNPNDAYACYQIGNTASMFGDYAGAKEYLRRALRPGGMQDPLRALVWNLLAETELRTGSPGEAEKCCRASLALVPVQMTARWYLVGAHIERKDFAAALVPLGEILAMFFDVPTPPPVGISVDLQMEESVVRQIMGQCCWKTGDTQAALRCFSEALRLDPSSPGIQANFATALRAAGPVPQAGAAR